MPSKLKTAPKKKATASTCPAKPGKTPLRFELPVLKWKAAQVANMIELRTSKQIKEDLRSRGLKIPKDKREMAMRLALHLAATGAVLTASII